MLITSKSNEAAFVCLQQKSAKQTKQSVSSETKQLLCGHGSPRQGQRVVLKGTMPVTAWACGDCAIVGLWDHGQETHVKNQKLPCLVRKKDDSSRNEMSTDELLPTSPEDCGHPFSKRTDVSVSQLVWTSLTKLDEAR